MSVIVTKLAEFRVQAATRVDEGAFVVSERVRVFVAIKAMSPVCRRAAARAEGERRALQKRRSSVLNEAYKAKTSE